MGLRTIVCTDCGQVVLKEAAYRCEGCENYFCPNCMASSDCCRACDHTEYEVIDLFTGVWTP